MIGGATALKSSAPVPPREAARRARGRPSPGRSRPARRSRSLSGPAVAAAGRGCRAWHRRTGRRRCGRAHVGGRRAAGRRHGHARLLESDPRELARVEHREVLDLGARTAREQVGRVERREAADQQVDRAPGRREALEHALDHHQRLGAHGEPIALVDRRRDDEVHRPRLVLEQQEDDALGRPRALARDDEAADAHLRAVGQVGQVGAGGDPARRQAFAQEAQRDGGRR